MPFEMGFDSHPIRPQTQNSKLITTVLEERLLSNTRYEYFTIAVYTPSSACSTGAFETFFKENDWSLQ